MDPPVPEQRCLEYQYTKISRWTCFGWLAPQVTEQRCLEYQYTQLDRWTYFGWWTPQYQSRDAINTSTQYLVDEPTLANGPPKGKRAEMPSQCYWHLLVKNGNFTLLLTSTGQEWQFHIATDIYWSRMAISHYYCHLLVKNGNFTLLLRSTGPEWQFDIATDIYWSRMAISHCYWHLLVKNGNFTLLLTSTGQEWQFHIATDIYWSQMAISRCTPRSASRSTPKCIMGYILWDVFSSHFGFLKKRWEFPLICE